MELYKELLIALLAQNQVDVMFPNIKVDVNEIVHCEAYKALNKIKAILHNDSLHDEECFTQIEELCAYLNSWEVVEVIGMTLDNG